MLEILVGFVAAILLILLIVGAVGGGIWWMRTKQPRNAGLKRLSLPEKQWAKVRMRLTQSMWDSMLPGEMMGFERDEDGRWVDSSGNDASMMVADEVMRKLIVSGTVEWSYGDVDADVLGDEVPLDAQQVLSDHFDNVLTASSHFQRMTSGI